MTTPPQQPSDPAAFGPPPQAQTAPPPKKRTGLIVGLVAAVVVVLVVVGIVVAVMVGSGSSSSPRAVSDTFMSALGAQDVAKAQSVACAAESKKITDGSDFKLDNDYKLDKFDYTFTGENATADDKHDLTYKVDATVTYQGQSRSQSGTFTLNTVKENGDWKVCGFDTQ